MTMRGRKDTVKAAEVLKAQESAKIPEVLKEQQEGAAALEALKPQKKVKTHKAQKTRRNKKHSLAAMVRAAADSKKRAVMSRVWNRRQKRLDHIAAVVRLAIRYLNARDRTTIYRNK